MKSLVLFYSFEGNTKLMAETIAETINADMLEIKPITEMQSKGFMKYVWGGGHALMKKKPSLQPLEKNPEDYDLIFIGTPVWAWTYAPPLNTFFSDHPLSGKKIALFCCHGGGKGKIFNKMRNSVLNNHVIGEIDFKEPKSKDTENNCIKAKIWAQNMIDNLTRNKSNLK